jgi:hypothetical protein
VNIKAWSRRVTVNLNLNVRVKGSPNVGYKKIEWFILWENGWWEEVVSSCLGQDAFFAEEWFPVRLFGFRDKTFDECFDNAVVGVTESLMPFHAFHGKAAGHGGKDDLVLEWWCGFGCEESPAVVCKRGSEGTVLVMKGHVAVPVKDGT